MKFELPVKEDKMLAKKADKPHAKILTHDTVGLSCVSALWILGKLQIPGGCLCRGLILL